MTSPDDVFEAMRRTALNDLVGGADPELVGSACDHLLARMTSIGPRARVVDFGCGIGRVGAKLMQRAAPPRGYLGIDVMPAVIDFCRTELQPRFADTAFELAATANDHYDRHIGSDERARSVAELSARYGSRFSHAYAFSVFTHLDAAGFLAALRFVATLIRARGEFLFTAFTLTDFSRARIAAGTTLFPLANHQFRDHDRVMVGDPSDPLAFIAYDRALIEKMVWEAGLVIAKIEYGTWMGGRLGESLQDLYVCHKPPRPVMNRAAPQDIA